MLHIDSSLGRVRERMPGFLAMLVISMATLLMTAQTAQWIGGDLGGDDATVRTPDGAPGLATSTYRPLPMAMTIPYAIAETQQTAVARLKRGSAIARIPRKLRGRARRLAAGLAIFRAAGAGHH